MRRISPVLVAVLTILLGGFVVMAQKAPQTEVQKTETENATKVPVKMSGYAEVTGIDAHIEEIKNDVLNFNARRRDASKKKDAAAWVSLLGDGDNWGYSNERGETFGKVQWVNDELTANF